MENMIEKQSAEFYTNIYKGQEYNVNYEKNGHPFLKILENNINKYNLQNSKALEIGCGIGLLQDVVQDYTGIDIADTLQPYFHKTFVKCSATSLSFKSNTFDLIWSYAVLEHIPDPEKALGEISRVLKPKGFLLLMPAWFCRSWAAKGYPVRPYSDFGLGGKIIKFSILIRDLIIIRSFIVFPRRIWILIKYYFERKHFQFKYKVLKPNFEKFWMSDSDAINSMDPFDVILWYRSRGINCINYPSLFKAFFVKTGLLVFYKKNI